MPPHDFNLITNLRKHYDWKTTASKYNKITNRNNKHTKIRRAFYVWRKDLAVKQDMINAFNMYYSYLVAREKISKNRIQANQIQIAKFNRFTKVNGIF